MIASEARTTLWAAGYILALAGLPILAHALLGGAGPAWVPAAIGAIVAVAGFVVAPVRSLVAFAVFMLFIDTVQVATAAPVKLIDEMVIPWLVLIIIVRERHRIRGAVSFPREAAVALVVAAALLSSLSNGVAASTWLPGMVLLGKGFAIFYVARLLPITADDVRWAMRLVLATGVIVLVLGGLELLAPQLFTAVGLRPSAERAGLPALKSLFYHQQLFGWFCGYVALYLFAHHAKLQRPWMLVLALLFSAGSILSARRRSMIAVLAGLAAGAGAEFLRGGGGVWARIRPWVPAIVGTLVLFVAFLPALAGLYQLTVDDYVIPPGPGGEQVLPGGSSTPDQVDAAPRIALYTTSVQIAQDEFPLGAGLGKFGSWMSRIEYSDVYREYGLDHVFGLSRQNPQFITDTFWPQVLGETGILGLAGYVAFLGALGCSLWQLSRRRDLAPWAAPVVLGTGMIFTQTIVESLASPILNSPPQVYLIMLSIGGVLSVTAREIRATDVPDAQEVSPS